MLQLVMPNARAEHAGSRRMKCAVYVSRLCSSEMLGHAEYLISATTVATRAASPENTATTSASTTAARATYSTGATGRSGNAY